MIYVAMLLVTYHVFAFASRNRLVEFVRGADDYACSREDFEREAQRLFKKSLAFVLIILGCIGLEIWFLFDALVSGFGGYWDALYLSMCLVWTLRILRCKEFLGYVKSWGFHTVAVMYYTYAVYRLAL